MPAAVGLAVLASPIIALIYQHGHFTAHDTTMTALALQAYAIGLAGYAAIRVLTPCFYALEPAAHADAHRADRHRREPGAELPQHGGLPPRPRRAWRWPPSCVALANVSQLAFALSRRVDFGGVGEWAGYLGRVLLAVARLRRGRLWPLVADATTTCTASCCARSGSSPPSAPRWRSTPAQASCCGSARRRRRSRCSGAACCAGGRPPRPEAACGRAPQPLSRAAWLFAAIVDGAARPTAEPGAPRRALAPSSQEPKSMTDPKPAAYAGPQRVFSGVQPSGDLHLGNYLGALVKFVALQDQMECLYCVVDLHAITQWQEPARLTAQTREIAAAYIAAGVDPAKAIIFPQSAVPGARRARLDLRVRRAGRLARPHDPVQGQGRQAQGARQRRALHLPGAAGGRHPALQGHPRAGRRGPDAAPGADARHRRQVQPRLRRARLLSADRAGDRDRGRGRG